MRYVLRLADRQLVVDPPVLGIEIPGGRIIDWHDHVVRAALPLEILPAPGGDSEEWHSTATALPR
jgi:hypothetical protein